MMISGGGSGPVGMHEFFGVLELFQDPAMFRAKAEELEGLAKNAEKWVKAEGGLKKAQATVAAADELKAAATVVLEDAKGVLQQAELKATKLLADAEEGLQARVSLLDARAAKLDAENKDAANLKKRADDAMRFAESLQAGASADRAELAKQRGSVEAERKRLVAVRQAIGDI
mgnify:FL=1